MTLVTGNHSMTPQEPNMPAIRDVGPYITRNTSKGAMVVETERVFSALASGETIDQVREAVLNGTLLPQASRTNRETIWDRIHYRYLAHHIDWIISSFVEALDVGPHSRECVSLCHLHYALRDHLTFDFVTEVLWHRGY